MADGYDDAALKHLPLIVTYGGKEASASTLRSRAVALPGDVTDVHPLTSVNGVALAADREDTDALWSALAGTESDSDSDSAKVPDADAAFHGGVAKVLADGRAEATRMSLGSSENADGDTVLARAVNELSAETGALFTIAAGNDGPGARTVRSPGAADAALTVGAVDSSDALADFSSRGPRYGDDALKPEITAPGVGILAARSQYIATGSGYYMTASGTSMATRTWPVWPRWSPPRTPTGPAAASRTLWSAPPSRPSTSARTTAATAGWTPPRPRRRSPPPARSTPASSSPGTDKGTVHSTAAWTNTGDHAVAVDLAVDAPRRSRQRFRRLPQPRRGPRARHRDRHGHHRPGQGGRPPALDRTADGVRQGRRADPHSARRQHPPAVVPRPYQGHRPLRRGHGRRPHLLPQG